MVYQKKNRKPINKYLRQSSILDLSLKNNIIIPELKESIEEIRKARDLIHIKGNEELDMGKIDIDFYYKNTIPYIEIYSESVLMESGGSYVECDDAYESEGVEKCYLNTISERKTIFGGRIKNKSELKKLLIQLNIN